MNLVSRHCLRYVLHDTKTILITFISIYCLRNYIFARLHNAVQLLVQNLTNNDMSKAKYLQNLQSKINHCLKGPTYLFSMNALHKSMAMFFITFLLYQHF